jgi:hypothetical protein
VAISPSQAARTSGGVGLALNRLQQFLPELGLLLKGEGSGLPRKSIEQGGHERSSAGETENEVLAEAADPGDEQPWSLCDVQRSRSQAGGNLGKV